MELALNQPSMAPERVLLPHEQTSVDAVYNKRVEEFDKIIEEKVSVSGGDDWHDGAFRATDNAAKIVTEGMATISPYLHAPVVEYPDESETRVTLGSRAAIHQNGYAFPVDVIGFRSAYPDNVIDPESNEEVTGTTPDSPLGKAILGQEVGAEVSYRNGERTFTARIERINQSSVREYFLQASSVELAITDTD